MSLLSTVILILNNGQQFSVRDRTHLWVKLDQQWHCLMKNGVLPV